MKLDFFCFLYSLRLTGMLNLLTIRTIFVFFRRDIHSFHFLSRHRYFRIIHFFRVILLTVLLSTTPVNSKTLLAAIFDVNLVTSVPSVLEFDKKFVLTFLIRCVKLFIFFPYSCAKFHAIDWNPYPFSCSLFIVWLSIFLLYLNLYTSFRQMLHGEIIKLKSY